MMTKRGKELVMDSLLYFFFIDIFSSMQLFNRYHLSGSVLKLYNFAPTALAIGLFLFFFLYSKKDLEKNGYALFPQLDFYFIFLPLFPLVFETLIKL